jgi:hypothetical protein
MLAHDIEVRLARRASLAARYGEDVAFREQNGESWQSSLNVPQSYCSDRPVNRSVATGLGPAIGVLLNPRCEAILGLCVREPGVR